MDTEQIIKQLDTFQVRLFQRQNGTVVPAAPNVLSDTLLLIRGLLVQLVDKVADAELDYRRSKASRFDELMKEGTKRSPAFDLLEMDKDLIEKKIATERLRNYMKYVDGLCTSVQSVLKVQSTSEKNQY
jgi:predicted nucleic-acid-binding protein